MDLLGDIVEKDFSDSEISVPMPPMPPVVAPLSASTFANRTGFPQIKKISAFKSKRKAQEKEQQSKPKEEPKPVNQILQSKPQSNSNMDYSHLTESEKIHLENIEYLNGLTEEQKLKEKEELIESMDPSVLMKLLMLTERRKKRQGENLKETKGTGKPEAESGEEDVKDIKFQGLGDEGLTTAGDWIGGFSKGGKSVTGFNDDGVNRALAGKAGLPSLEDDLKEDPQNKKSVRFEEEEENQDQQAKNNKRDQLDFEDLDEIAPPSYQIVNEASEVPTNEAMSTVHFPKPDPSSYSKLDINDPSFDEQLHEKYFPDLPRDIEKLSWMQPLKPVTDDDLIISDVKELRFDFQGELVIVNEGAEIDTSKGLHHHAEKANLPGYTLKELSHLSRSRFPAQRCIATQTLGRILYKLSLPSYYKFMPEFVDDDGEVVGDVDIQAVEEGQLKFKELLWDLIKEQKVIETLEEFSEDSNLSVRNYAVDALWCWRQGQNKSKENMEDKQT